MSTTRIHRHLHAPRARVYQALLDPRAIAAWRVQFGMTSEVHAFDAREGGRVRISPTDNEAGWTQALQRLAALVEGS